MILQVMLCRSKSLESASSIQCTQQWRVVGNRVGQVMKARMGAASAGIGRLPLACDLASASAQGKLFGDGIALSVTSTFSLAHHVRQAHSAAC